MSASRTPTVRPWRARATARLTVTELLPTPPLPLAMARMRVDAGTCVSVACWRMPQRAFAITSLRSSGVISPQSMRTSVTPGWTPTRCSISRLMSARNGHPPIVSLTTTRTVPSGSTVTAGTIPSVTMSAPSSGSTTDSSTATTSSRVGGGAVTPRFYRSTPCNLANVAQIGAPLPSRDVLRVLGDNTRYAIYLELARSPRPLVTAEIADVLGLHPNTVRPHLERMRDVGLLDVTTDARGEVGRPQHRYSLSPDAPSLGLEPPTMPMLARMVLSMARRIGASPTDAVAVGEAEGADRAARYDDAPSALEALVADLDRLGFDPVVIDASGPAGDGRPATEGGADVADDVDDGPVTAVVSFANCPFADLARDHPDLVCALHRGLVTGFVARMGDAEVTEFCSLAHRTPCQVAVTTR